jgi:glucose uptake protein GlcU
MSFAAITLCVASQRVFVVVSVYLIMIQSGNFWIHPRMQLKTLNLRLTSHSIATSAGCQLCLRTLLPYVSLFPYYGSNNIKFSFTILPSISIIF